MEKMPNLKPEQNLDMSHKEYFREISTEKGETSPTVEINRSAYTLDGKPDESKPSYEVVEFLPSKESIKLEPIIFMQGFMATATDYQESLAALSEKSGRRVIAWNEYVGAKEVGKDIRYPGEEKNTQTQVDKIVAMDELLKRLNIEKADVVAHSEGCIHALSLELLSPRFKKMILLNPAGITNNTSILKLGLAGLREKSSRDKVFGAFGTPNEFLPKGYKDLSAGNFKMKLAVVSNMISSMWGMTKDDMVMSKLKELSYQNMNTGTEIDVVTSQEDKLFDSHNLSESFIAAGGVDSIEEAEKTDHPGLLKDVERTLKYVLPKLTPMSN